MNAVSQNMSNLIGWKVVHQLYGRGLQSLYHYPWQRHKRTRNKQMQLGFITSLLSLPLYTEYSNLLTVFSIVSGLSLISKGYTCNRHFGIPSDLNRDWIVRLLAKVTGVCPSHTFTGDKVWWDMPSLSRSSAPGKEQQRTASLCLLVNTKIVVKAIF